MIGAEGTPHLPNQTNQIQILFFFTNSRTVSKRGESQGIILLEDIQKNKGKQDASLSRGP